MKVMLVFNGISALFGLISAIALYATYLGKPEAKWSVYLAGAFCLVIAVYQTVSFAFTLELRQKFMRGRTGAERAIESKGVVLSSVSAETAQLVNAPSVTEDTTQLLEASPRIEE